MTFSMRGLGAVLACAVALAALAGCSNGSSSPAAGPTTTSSGTSSDATSSGTTPSTGTTESTATSGSPAPGTPSPYLPVPDGVVLTDQGSELGVGESATVAFRPRQDAVGVLKLTVRKLEKADIKALEDWQLDSVGRASSLYYVTVTVKNRGDTDLGGRRVPLYVMDARNTLVESNAFRSTFAPCPSEALPKVFGPDASVTTCLLYLVPGHGDLISATFRPTEDFNPITWVGKVSRWKPPKTKRATGRG